MILIVAVMAGILVALSRGGDLRSLAHLPLRLGWLAVLCLLAQIYVTMTPADQLKDQRTFHAILILGSYAALVVVVWANRGIAWIPIIGLGLLLNLVVMAANGGFMPISQEALLAVGSRTPETMPTEGARLTKTKDVLLSPEHTRLAFLSDVIVAPRVPVAKVYSVGDLVISVGAFALFQAAVAPAKRRSARDGSRAKAT